MEIKRLGSQASTRGSSDYFTGTVRIDPLFQAPAPARVSSAAVTFEPGARTAWHKHPLGQTLIAVAGLGRVQRWDGRSRRSDQVTLSGLSQARSTGMVRRQRRH
jgi:quercetin dioxygenase-like cupin family protein